MAAVAPSTEAPVAWRYSFSSATYSERAHKEHLRKALLLAGSNTASVSEQRAWLADVNRDIRFNKLAGTCLSFSAIAGLAGMALSGRAFTWRLVLLAVLTATLGNSVRSYSQSLFGTHAAFMDTLPHERRAEIKTLAEQEAWAASERP